MTMGTKLLFLWIGFLASTCGSVSDGINGFSPKDGAFYTDDAVIINGEWFLFKYNLSFLNSVMKIILSNYNLL